MEGGVFRPIGGRATRVDDVRIVAATHRNLTEECRLGHFRRDLFYRLAVASIRVPALRHRTADIPILADRFAARFGASLTPELLEVLTQYEWPGNVRELRNVIQRMAVQGIRADQVLPAAPGDPVRDGKRIRPLGAARRLATAAFERRYLQAVLDQCGGNMSRAADVAGVSRQALTQLARKHELRAKDRIAAAPHPPDQPKLTPLANPRAPKGD